ncbi:hypothetical protein GCM10027063_14130 [Promicromonospora xylanilytica]
MVVLDPLDEEPDDPLDEEPDELDDEDEPDDELSEEEPDEPGEDSLLPDFMVLLVEVLRESVR